MTKYPLTNQIRTSNFEVDFDPFQGISARIRHWEFDFSQSKILLRIAPAVKKLPAGE